MSKRSLLPQTRRHISLYNEDWDFLETNFGPRAIREELRKIGPGKMAKLIVHKWVTEKRAQIAAKLDAEEETS